MTSRDTTPRPDPPLLPSQILAAITDLSPPEAPPVFAATVLRVGSLVLTFAPQDKVLGFGGPIENQGSRHIISPEDQLYHIPRSVTSEEACSHTSALLRAIPILKQKLGIAFTASQKRPSRSSGEEQSGPRIVIIGGETQLGLALTQILVRARPDARVVVLISMKEDPMGLFQRASLMLRCGAWYAIDGDTPDLMEYAGLREEGGTELVISVVGREVVRGDLLARVDCFAQDAEVRVEGEEIANGEFRKAVYWMLEEAAGEMEKWQELPDCGFGEDGGDGGGGDWED